MGRVAVSDRPRGGGSAARAWQVELSLCGELDLGAAAEVRRRLSAALAARPRRLLVDVTGADFVDLYGLSVLVAARAQASQHDVDFVVRGDGRVRRLAALAGLSGVLPLEVPAQRR